MPLQKRAIPITFALGRDGKIDPFQIPLGKFASVINSVFTKTGRMTKRYGNRQLSVLPGGGTASMGTFNGGLLAIGTQLQAYIDGTGTWASKGNYQPLSLTVEPLVRSAANQTQCDVATAANGLVCCVWTETQNSVTAYKYAVFDSTSACVVNPTAIVAGSSGTVSGSPRLFVLGNFFVIVFTATISATSHLQFVAIPTNNPTTISTAADISTTYTPASTVAFDGVVANNSLYIAWNSSGGAGIKVTYIDSTLTQHNTVTADGSHVATMVSVTADLTTVNPTIWVSYYDSSGSTGYTLALSSILVTILAAKKIISSGTILNITSSAQNGVNTIFYEVSNAYGYDSGIASNYIEKVSVAQTGLSTVTVTIASPGVFTTTSAHGLSLNQRIFFTTTGALPTGITAGTYYFVKTIPSSTTFTVSATAGGSVINTSGTQSGVHSYVAPTILIRSVGLSSKSFLQSGTIFLLVAYSSPTQPTNFLINSGGSVVGKLAYANSGGYLTLGLPSAVITGTAATIGYLFKDLIEPVNKAQGVTATAGVYSQTGVNAAYFDFNATPLTAETGGALHLTGSQLWMYDGTQLVEHGFHLWPDSVEVTSSTSGGSITDQQYFYQALYEWTDASGMIHRSAPSIPVSITTSGGNTSTNTIYVPTLRVTLKTQVKIMLYRWSVAQQSFYQVTSLINPTLNSTTVDYITFTDTLADSSIIGNSLIYTTGGVIENIGAPATDLLSLFDSRLFLVNSENRNLLWFSKEIIDAVPAEMSDLFTKFIDPTLGAQGNTGPISVMAPMDDKLVMYKPNAAAYYFNGEGPDNLNNNNQYSKPIFIASTVGCTNPNVAIGKFGQLFQSDKGIWQLGRDLQTSYIGAPVEDFNSQTVLSANVIPGTNQIRFDMSGGTRLMYDYYVDQWGQFVGINSASSTLFDDLQTSLDVNGRIFQEDPSSYLDGSNPVNMSFTTGWIAGAGVQGYQRAYWAFLLGQYISPHKLTVGIAYDYSPTIRQQMTITPDNYEPNWGGLPTWGAGTAWGGVGNKYQWQINFKYPTCEALQLTVTEHFDPSKGQPAGAGLTLTGLNLVVGLKKDYPRNIPAKHRVG